MLHLSQLSATNFLSLRDVTVNLAELSVLVGPNGAGKSNLLRTIQFLGDVARLDLGPALEQHGGFAALRYRGAGRGEGIQLGLKARVTKHASDKATDDYTLSLVHHRRELVRDEVFVFKRTKGAGRRITSRGGRFEVLDENRPVGGGELTEDSAVLSTLPRLGKTGGGEQVRALGDLLSGLRVFDVDVPEARRPAVIGGGRGGAPALRSNASNLASFLYALSKDHAEVFALLVDDMRAVLPGLAAVHFEHVGGAAEAVAVFLEERGLPGRTPLAAASFGTVRALALLAMLHDPHPPKLTCVEEIDHGLHPYALDRIVDRLRSATRRTQLLVATHSPALVNRLDAGELIVCERDLDTGASRIPAVEASDVRAMAAASALSLGELWFSGSLGGVP